MKSLIPFGLLFFLAACSKPCPEEIQVVSSSLEIEHNINNYNVRNLLDTLHFVIDLPTTLVNELDGNNYEWNGETPILALELRPYRPLSAFFSPYNFRSEASAHESFLVEVVKGENASFNRIELFGPAFSPSLLFQPEQDESGFHWEIKLVPTLASGAYGLYWGFYDEEIQTTYNADVEKKRCEDFIVLRLKNTGMSNIERIGAPEVSVYREYLKMIEERALTFFNVES